MTAFCVSSTNIISLRQEYSTDVIQHVLLFTARCMWIAQYLTRPGTRSTTDDHGFNVLAYFDL